MSLEIRFAEPGDAAVVLEFVRALAAHAGHPNAVEVDAATLRAQLSERAPPFECLLAERAGVPLGMALFYGTYSTWRGKRGIWLEDLIVLPKARGQGVGKALLASLARLTVERDCARLEWMVIDANTASIAFYEALGARRLQDWTVCRLAKGPLASLADSGERIHDGRVVDGPALGSD